jgi:hypothetical protein
MRRGMSDAMVLAAGLFAGLVIVTGSAFLLLGIWLAWPNDGESEYSTVANIGQLTLIGLGLVLAGVAASEAFGEERAGQSFLFSALALATWLVWWIVLAR